MSKYEVLQILVEQAELVRGCSAVDEGELSRFRAAIEMKSSPEVAQWVESSFEQVLFDSLEDVERSEEQYIEESRSDIAVQCCMILELALHCTYIVDEDMMHRRRSSLFDHCRSLVIHSSGVTSFPYPHKMSKYEVLQILVEQAELVRSGSALDEGKLSHFRTAAEMESFPKVARWVDSSLEQALFHSLEDVQRMEEQYIEGSRSDLAVQCCIILELALHCTYIIDEEMMRLRRSSFFDHCRTLTEIAHLRFRLDFLGPRSLVRHNVEFSMKDAVTACARISAPTWCDMLLLFKMTDHDGLFSLLHCFAEFH